MRTFIWSIVILVSAAAIGVFEIANIQSPLRPWLAFWFLLVCPGMAFVPLLRLRESRFELVIAIALSIVLDTIVAEFMLLIRYWYPPIILLILIIITLIGVILQLVQKMARPRSVERSV